MRRRSEQAEGLHVDKISSNKTLLTLVDISPLIYRCYHILPQEARGRVLVVLRSHIARVIARIKSVCGLSDVVFALDSIPLYRKKLFPTYKAHRPPMAQEIITCFQALPEMLARMGQTALKEEGHEADDIIATLAHEGEKRKRQTLIISPDKDLLQLVGVHTRLCQRYDLTGPFFTPKDVLAKYKILPEKIVDWLSLCGDIADNIPGVPGIGPVRASRLLASMGSLEAICEHPEKVPVSYLRFDFARYVTRLRLNQKLIVLKKDLPLQFET